ADVIGVPVERPEIVETTAMGAAGLAGIASGVWKDAAEFHAVRKFTTFAPRISSDERSALMSGWSRAVNTALFWAER
ncbi:MAG TPA: glycerol kinase, partial [Gemmatimonadaceae bacterium]